MIKSNRYFKWIRLETPIVKIFQEYIEDKRWYKTYLSKRGNKQASVDFLGRFYDSDTGITLKDVAVEVRSLNIAKSDIESAKWYIEFPIEKLNELMKFWRMWKEVYVVYLLGDKVYFIDWNYYLSHNFELWKIDWEYYIKLPVRNFIFCGIYQNQ